ncbi:MAG: molybdopterin oxidoreductase family protein, partial [Actinomycetota bacterium]
RFALLCRRANDRGALRAGLHPALLPGGRSVADEAARAMVEVAWGTLLPSEPGRDAAAILKAAAEREIEVLFLVGVDPLRDFPDAALARQALQNVPYKVVVDIDAENMAIYADAMLPAAPYLEKDGHYTDWEGRAQRLRAVRPPHGLARSEWEIFQEVSEVMGADMGFHSLDALHDEMARLLGPSPAEAVDGRVPSASRVRSADSSPPYAPRPQSQEEPASPEERTELVLFTYPLLVDEGRLSAGADLLRQALEEQPFVEIHPSDADRLGLKEGATARLRTDAGEAELPMRITDGIAPGAVFVPYNQPGFAANKLLAGRLTATVGLEAAEAEAAS